MSTGDLHAFVDFLWESDVVTFGDFVVKSGRRTPYFLDSGRYRNASQLARLGAFYADVIAREFGDGVDLLFGPAYKGIPLAVTTGIALYERHGHDVGVCFDRKEAKDHGEGGSLVGAVPQDGTRVVIVEDVTTAGTSIRQTVPMLRAVADVDLVGLVVGVDRQERGTRQDISALEELGEELGLRTVALATIDDVVARLGPQLDQDVLDRIAAYRAEYGPRQA
ncbi:MAG: orotate phosphoribosyltransferase [Nitriliruptoraceae bacterium]